FLLAYGLRRGEVLGLSWDDVDFAQGVIHVRRQVVRAGGRLHLGPVKTTAGVRELPLLEIVRQALAEHEAKQLLGNSVSVLALAKRPRSSLALTRRTRPRSSCSEEGGTSLRAAPGTLPGTSVHAGPLAPGWVSVSESSCVSRGGIRGRRSAF